MEKTNEKQSLDVSRRSREGNLNPMFGKRQSLKTKQKISDSQKERYEMIRRKIQSEQANPPLGRTDKAARMELLNQCLNKDTIGFDTVEQAHNFVAIMLQYEGENHIQRVIKEELDKMLRDKNQHSKQIGD